MESEGSKKTIQIVWYKKFQVIVIKHFFVCDDDDDQCVKLVAYEIYSVCKLKCPVST